ncbi:uncharacterized protein GGS22DRAFT_158110 [Annulohypoxylon maeteangense]|uniref:uncharacterized protein n=1 Tax=Annulohypoxylon maeteangense TaxID=1927788 RepID=UPI00200751AC|nr:uncharacterized protein GGS22DRAFT_158110 [Annulohypoxylon maeteangense]KAI0886537.1 hypothetical protein GGS22DRAFT_158110 [Annulohypoxylon maeteangense]
MAPMSENPDISTGGNLDGPAIQPPTGITPNFDNPPNKNNLVRVVLILFIVITSVSVLIRMYSRIMLKKVKITDILGLAAFVIYIAFIYLYFKLLNSYGWFVHMWDLRLRDFPEVNQMYFQGIMIYFGIIILIRSAIMLEWIAIFAPQRTRGFFFWSSSFVLVIHNLIYIAMIITELAGCSPFEKNWNLLIPGKCIDTIAIAIINSAVNLAFDLIIFFLPQKVIWGLQMKTKKKIGVSFLFAVGVIAIVAATFRLVFSLRFYTSKDTTYAFSGVSLWCHAEVTCGFIVFCCPVAPKTLSHLELQKLASGLRSWAGNSVRKLVSPGASSKGSIIRATHKQFAPGTPQNSDEYEMDITVVRLIPAEYIANGPN